jgi:hypothetical protein
MGQPLSIALAVMLPNPNTIKNTSGTESTISFDEKKKEMRRLRR